MRFWLYFASLIVLALFFSVQGIFWIAIAWSSTIQAGFIFWIASSPWSVALLGISLLLVSISITAYVWAQRGQRSYSIRLGAYQTDVDQEVVEKALSGYFQTVFPQYTLPFRLKMGPKRLKIHVQFPPISPQEQQRLTGQIEQELTHLLRHNLGYYAPVQIYLLCRA